MHPAQREIDIALFGIVHRCGSTLLQRLFNANPQTLIWGENARALTRLATMEQRTLRMSERSAKFRLQYVESGFQNLVHNLANMTPDPRYISRGAEAAVRGYFGAMYAEYSGRFRTIGFKEVKHGELAIRLFRRAYPRARIVLLARNPEDCWHSLPESWIPRAYSDLDGFIDVWLEHIRFYRQWAQDDPLSQLIWLERIGSDPNTERTIRHLAGISPETYREVTSKRSGSTREAEFKPEPDVARIRSRCEPEYAGVRSLSAAQG